MPGRRGGLASPADATTRLAERTYRRTRTPPFGLPYSALLKLARRARGLPASDAVARALAAHFDAIGFPATHVHAALQRPAVRTALAQTGAATVPLRLGDLTAVTLTVHLTRHVVRRDRLAVQVTRR
ncbi:hypothetical protein [Conexibacter arvalis]|uniref:Uncharacterized protein n=1 Tax=Conexibacter arvalis TaxID=912552 RepID=A0A840ID90_9ACTN|nr:hypothetical protein [Conexibacter arvalis]MBB4662034.1 hypothetical protein [Conexibacter arvalis]